MDAATQAMLKDLFETKLNSAMRLYLETCTHCGACVEACHVYNSMPEMRLFLCRQIRDCAESVFEIL